MDATKPGSPLEELDIQLPPLQSTLVQALELMQQPEGFDFEDIIRLVEHDPGVTTRLLRMVNSAYYGQRRSITSVHRAVMLMGADPVLGIVMSMSLQQAKMAGSARLPTTHLIRHSVATAFLARHLVAYNPATPAPDPSILRDVFTAALLHDIGKLVLLYNNPLPVATFYLTDAERTPTDAEVLEQERTLFGYDHVEAGVYLSEQLHFPDMLSTAIAWHHRYDQLDPEEAEIKRVLHPVVIANKAANMLGFALNRAATSRVTEDEPEGLLLQNSALGYESAGAIWRAVKAVEDELDAYVEAVA